MINGKSSIVKSVDVHYQNGDVQTFQDHEFAGTEYVPIFVEIKNTYLEIVAQDNPLVNGVSRVCIPLGNVKYLITYEPPTHISDIMTDEIKPLYK